MTSASRILGGLLLALWLTGAGAAELSVFLPDAPSNLRLRNALLQDPVTAGLEIRVHARFRTLMRRLDVDEVAFVLAPSPALARHAGYRPLWQCHGPQASTTWHLISLLPGVELSALDHLQLGSPDIGDRQIINALIARSFEGVQPFARVRTVSQADDLLKMLGLELAEVGLVDDRILALARERFTTVRVLASSGAVPQPQIFVHHSAEPTEAPRFAELTAASLDAMGFTAVVPLADPLPEAEGGDR